MSNFIVVGDIPLNVPGRDLRHVLEYCQVYPIQPDEIISLNWRVVDKKSGRTMAVMGGGGGRQAAICYADFLNGS